MTHSEINKAVKKELKELFPDAKIRVTKMRGVSAVYTSVKSDSPYITNALRAKIEKKYQDYNLVLLP